MSYFFMARANSYGRLRRLELLTAQLKQDGLCTIKDLAESQRVSVRTIARDLDLLREQGLPINADRGRGGGVSLDRRWGIGRLNLSYTEAVDLLISIAVAEKMNSPIFLANLGSIKHQLVASFSPEKRKKIDQIKSRILVGTTASTAVQGTMAPAGSRVIQALHQSFLNQNSLNIRYQDEGGTTTRREIEAHYLLLNYPTWYVLAFDHLRSAPRTFRCDRILEAAASATHFRVLSKDSFKQTLEGNGLENLKTALC